jgi:hypothetical protein
VDEPEAAGEWGAAEVTGGAGGPGATHAPGEAGTSATPASAAKHAKDMLAQAPAPVAGRVDLNLNPKTPDSMPWQRWKAPATGGEVGRTVAAPKYEYHVQKQRGANKFRVRYTLRLDATIKLDPDKTKKLHQELDGMYGHEQRHVGNLITILQRAKAELEKVAGVEYKSQEAARKAGERNIRRIADTVQEAIRRDSEHSGKDPKSPAPGRPYAPIGTMPDEPEAPNEAEPHD